MAETVISSDDFSQAQNFLVQYLRDAGYDGSLEDGTAIYDLLIKGMSLLYILFKNDVDKAESYLSITRALENADLLGDELDTVIDTILDNWFVTRKGGTSTTGRVRLFYSRPRDFVQFTTSTTLISANNVLFTPVEEVTVSSSDFTSVINSIGTGVEYYIDVDVVSSENDTAEILPGTALNSYISDIYFLRAEAAENFVPGTLQESNEDFIYRTQNAITTRELVTERAIETVLMDEFSGIDSVYVAGFGDDEQLRDHTSFDYVDVHVGNKADIYIGGDLTQNILEFTIPTEGNVLLDTYFAEIITANLVTIDEDTSEELLEEVEYTWESVDEGKFTSVGQPIELSFPECVPGDVVRITVLSHLLPIQVEEFVTDHEQRVACYDPIVKAKYPVILGISLRAKATKDGLTDEDIANLIAIEITNFIIGLKSGEVFVLSELIYYLHAQLSYISHILLPITVNYSFTDPKSGIKVSGTLENEFVIPETLSDGTTEISKQISWNTIQFYTSTNLLNISVTS